MKKSFLTISSLAILFTVALSAHAAPAQAADLSGWAWSSNTGWISFNSSDLSGAGGGPYKVTADATGNLSGYAWSSNLGWLSFNQPDLSGCAGTAAPAINLTTGAVTGWARFLSGAGRTDGWDGCVELSGTKHTSPDLSGNGGVTMDPATGIFNGYAWGGNVVGWIDFAPSTTSGSTITVKCPNGCQGGPLPITGTCVAAPATIPSGGSVNFTLSNINDQNPGVTGAYTYVWATGAGNVSNSLNPYNNYVYPANTNVSAAIYSTSVQVTDSAGHSSVISCGQVTENGTNNITNTVTLGIGNTPATATRTALQVSQGNPFALAWSNPLDLTSYSCLPAITGANAPTAWGSGWGTTANGSVSYLTNTTVPKGTYSFSILCTSTSGGADVSSNPVTLVVTQSTETEF